MASSLAPKVLAFKVDAAIAKGKAVKIGTDNKHVAVASAASDKLMGVAQGAASAAEDAIEIGVNGGGGKGLLQGTTPAGTLLTAHTDGSLKAVSSGEYYIAQQLQDGVANDLVDILVVSGIY